MGVRRHDHGAVEHARQLDIVDVARAAGEEALVFNAPDGLTDAVSIHCKAILGGNSVQPRLAQPAHAFVDEGAHFSGD
jgi:hypothetical protein